MNGENYQKQQLQQPVQQSMPQNNFNYEIYNRGRISPINQSEPLSTDQNLFIKKQN
jgi:hypothetical protein